MAAEAQGCSPATGYKWIRRFVLRRSRGPGHDRSSRPHRSPARLSARSRSPRSWPGARRRQKDPIASAGLWEKHPRRVHWVLSRMGAPRLRDLDRPTRTVVRYERERPGELLDVDIKKQGQIPEGGGWRIHGREHVPAGATGERLRLRPCSRRRSFPLGLRGDLRRRAQGDRLGLHD